MSNLRKALDLRPATLPPVQFSAPPVQTPVAPAPPPPTAPAPSGFAALVAKAAAQTAAPIPQQATPTTVAQQISIPAMGTPALPIAQMESIFQTPVTLVNDMTTWPDGAISGEQFSAQLKMHIDDVANHMGRGDVGDALNRALVFIGNHPKMKDLVLSLDMQVLLKALQASSGIVLAEKSEKSTARTKKKQEQNELLAMMGNIFSGGVAPTGLGS